MVDDHTDQMIAQLIGNGFFDVRLTDDGVIVYEISEKAEEIAPEIYAEVLEAMNKEFLEYIKLGYIKTRFDSQLSLEYKFTDLGLDHLRSLGYNID